MKFVEPRPFANPDLAARKQGRCERTHGDVLENLNIILNPSVTARATRRPRLSAVDLSLVP
jgi:hypothetical protein